MLQKLNMLDHRYLAKIMPKISHLILRIKKISFKLQILSYFCLNEYNFKKYTKLTNLFKLNYRLNIN